MIIIRFFTIKGRFYIRVIILLYTIKMRNFRLLSNNHNYCERQTLKNIADIQFGVCNKNVYTEWSKK